MWSCPKCNHKFFNRNQQHSCGNHTVNEFLAGKTAAASELFHQFLAEYRKIGEFALHPVKTRVALLTKMRFCSINKIGPNFLEGHLVLTEPFPQSSEFYRIENLANRFFVHHFRISAVSETAPLERFMRMAYEVGNRAHVGKGSR